MSKKVKRDDKGTTDPFSTPYVQDIVNPQKSRNQLAAEHSSLRQSSPGSTEALGHLRTRRGNIEDLKPFAGDITPGGFSHAGEVGLRLFDAAGQAGATGALHPTANPLRPADHQHRDSATPANGSHSLESPRSNAIWTGSPSNVASGPRAAANGGEEHPVRGLENNFAHGWNAGMIRPGDDRGALHSRAVDSNAPNYAQPPVDHPTAVKHQVLDMLKDQARRAMG